MVVGSFTRSQRHFRRPGDRSKLRTARSRIVFAATSPSLLRSSLPILTLPTPSDMNSGPLTSLRLSTLDSLFGAGQNIHVNAYRQRVFLVKLPRKNEALMSECIITIFLLCADTSACNPSCHWILMAGSCNCCCRNNFWRPESSRVESVAAPPPAARRPAAKNANRPGPKLQVKERGAVLVPIQAT